MHPRRGSMSIRTDGNTNILENRRPKWLHSLIRRYAWWPQGPPIYTLYLTVISSSNSEIIMGSKYCTVKLYTIEISTFDANTIIYSLMIANMTRILIFNWHRKINGYVHTVVQNQNKHFLNFFINLNRGYCDRRSQNDARNIQHNQWHISLHLRLYCKREL